VQTEEDERYTHATTVGVSKYKINEEEDRSPYHCLGSRCCANMMVRYSVVGAYLMELEELTYDETSNAFVVCKNLEEFS